MKSGYRYFGSLLLAAALLTPAALSTVALAQDNDHHDAQHQRVYDRVHKQYHNWDANEDKAYRQYLSEQHKGYRDYAKLSHNEQNEYWKWRNDHPDAH